MLTTGMSGEMVWMNAVWTSGTWEWLDGTALSSQPSYQAGHCVVFYKYSDAATKLYTADCTDELSFICEYP